MLYLFSLQSNECLSISIKKDTVAVDGSKINWFEFEWLANPDYFNLNVEKAHMLVDVRFEGLPAPFPLYFRLMATENTIYNKTKDAMIWHYPAFEQKIVRRQSAGRSVIEHFPGIEIKLGDSRLNYGLAAFKVVTDPRATGQNAHAINVGGTISPVLFSKKVLFIDFPNRRIGYSDAIPEGYLNRGIYTKLQFVMGYITIPIKIRNKKYWFWLSGDSTPVLEVYNEKLFNRIKSNIHTKDSLLVFSDFNKIEIVSGTYTYEDVYFETFKLNRQNVYFVDREKTRFDGKRISGTISYAFFFDYTIVIDYKNQRFGLVPK
ncbi:MAG: hypothetical protein KGZ97_06340 [Bacteroidetes bacterium]|nr:hypothetical protein [Bacteroidota bacterium]